MVIPFELAGLPEDVLVHILRHAGSDDAPRLFTVLKKVSSDHGQDALADTMLSKLASQRRSAMIAARKLRRRIKKREAYIRQRMDWWLDQYEAQPLYGEFGEDLLDMDEASLQHVKRKLTDEFPRSERRLLQSIRDPKNISNPKKRIHRMLDDLQKTANRSQNGTRSRTSRKIVSMAKRLRLKN